MRHVHTKVIVALALLSLASSAGAETIHTNFKSEIETIEKEQENSNATNTRAIKKVEDRNSFKSFLIGTDYKNTGLIRSEVEKTEMRIHRLQVIASTTSDIETKTDLDIKIATLKQSDTEMKQFIQSNEARFSFFGWFMKFF